MSDTSNYIALGYGLIVIFLGPGSMLYHASGKKWGGWFDMISMVAWVGFSMSYTLTRILNHLFDAPLWIIWVLALIIVGGIGLRTLLNSLDDFRPVPENAESEAEIENEADGAHGLDSIFFVSVAWIIVEIIVWLWFQFGNGPGFNRDVTWLIWVIIMYVLAFVAWIPTNGEIDIGPISKNALCAPKSFLQGHGFWHLFTALATLFVYLYFMSEIPITA